MSPRTRFENEAKGNSEMGYCLEIHTDVVSAATDGESVLTNR